MAAAKIKSETKKIDLRERLKRNRENLRAQGHKAIRMVKTKAAVER